MRGEQEARGWASVDSLRQARSLRRRSQSSPTLPVSCLRSPDDLSDSGEQWRQTLLRYNEQPEGNPLGLCPAYQLYENGIYERLVDQFGVHNVYILSAGWGLIEASFLTPHYDITFSQSGERYKRRRKVDSYGDFRMLPDITDDDIVFFGGKDYLPLFCSLTDTVRGRKTVFYNSGSVPQARGCRVERFETTTRTNWHYECANTYPERRDPVLVEAFYRGVHLRGTLSSRHHHWFSLLEGLRQPKVVA